MVFDMHGYSYIHQGQSRLWTHVRSMHTLTHLNLQTILVAGAPDVDKQSELLGR
jgi:hypothetical protein